MESNTRYSTNVTYTNVRVDMNDNETVLREIKEKIRTFVTEREWHLTHNAKNLSMAIVAEAAELVEHFLWIDGDEANKKMETHADEIQQEIADIVYMVLCLCNQYNIDLSKAIEHKMSINAKRYPLEKAKGNTRKYTEFT